MARYVVNELRLSGETLNGEYLASEPHIELADPDQYKIVSMPYRYSSIVLDPSNFGALSAQQPSTDIRVRLEIKTDRQYLHSIPRGLSLYRRHRAGRFCSRIKSKPHCLRDRLNGVANT